MDGALRNRAITVDPERLDRADYAGSEPWTPAAESGERWQVYVAAYLDAMGARWGPGGWDVAFSPSSTPGCAHSRTRRHWSEPELSVEIVDEDERVATVGANHDLGLAAQPVQLPRTRVGDHQPRARLLAA